MALEKCVSGLLTLQNLLPRSWGLLTHKCQRVPSAHLTQPAWQTCCFSRSPHHLWNIKSPHTGWSDCKVILKTAFFPQSSYSWAALAALPPCLLPSSSCPALPCPGATWHIALPVMVLSALCPYTPQAVALPGSSQLFPGSQLSIITQQIKAACDFPSSQLLCATWLPALSKKPPAFLQSCPPGTSLPCALVLLVQLHGRSAGFC